MKNSVTAKRRPRWVSVAVALVLLVALLVALYWFMTDGPGARLLSPAGSTVAEFSDTGNQTTSSFQVRPGWAIQWESSGQSFALGIGGDRDFGTVITLDEPGSGVTSPTGRGTFHLEVIAQGAWQIQVVQGD